MRYGDRRAQRRQGVVIGGSNKERGDGDERDGARECIVVERTMEGVIAGDGDRKSGMRRW